MDAILKGLPQFASHINLWGKKRGQIQVWEEKARGESS